MVVQEQGKLTQSGKLCATPFGVDVVGITELVALTGALVGGECAFECSCIQACEDVSFVTCSSDQTCCEMA